MYRAIFNTVQCNLNIKTSLDVIRKHFNMSVNITTRPAEFIYVAFPDKPVYLQRFAFSNIETESTAAPTTGAISKYLSDKTSCFVVFSSKINEESDIQFRYIQSAIETHKVYRQSTEWVYANFAHAIQFPKKSFSAPKRGVCLYLTNGEQVKYDLVQNILSFIKDEQSLKAYELKKSDTKDCFILNCLTETADGDKDVYYKTVCRESIEGLSEQAKIASPIFAVPDISPVYHSYREARLVLEKLAETPEVQELMDIADKHVSIETSCDQTLTHPFVVVEGMDATGKTTLTEVLEKKLSAARFHTPPPQITHLRPFFDRYPEIVRRAYYSMGNYIVARDIITECQSRPVIMDRFWHSTTAYGIANETSSGDLPEAGSYLYKWPTDLLKPTLVLFLTVTEDVRQQRLSGRQETFEEKSLDRDQLFRQRLCEAYRRMSEPACIEIDAGGTVEEVRNKALSILNEYGVKLGETDSEL